MQAVVFHGVGDIRLDDVKEPRIEEPTDAIIRVSTTAICGTDLHMVRGTMPGMKPGTILGHEATGIIEEVGKSVRNLRPGDRVVVSSTIGCGYCSYCRAGYFAQCDNANPNGAQAGTCFFGGPMDTGPVDGLQAEFARIPFAATTAIRLPDDIDDDSAILVSDIFPTGYFGAKLAEIKSGDTVAVFGCGPVGLFAIASAFYLGASRVLAVDRISSRLELATRLGAESINFEDEHPAKVIFELTGGIGVDRAIDAVGVDAEPASHGAASPSRKDRSRFEQELNEIAPKTNPKGGNWVPGEAPSQSLEWCIDSLAKAGTLGIIGVYPTTANFFPLGKAMNRNITIKMGNCNHRKYIPKLLGLIRSRTVDIDLILTNCEPLTSALDAYKSFDLRQAGWIKTALAVGEACPV